MRLRKSEEIFGKLPRIETTRLWPLRKKGSATIKIKQNKDFIYPYDTSSMACTGMYICMYVFVRG